MFTCLIISLEVVPENKVIGSESLSVLRLLICKVKLLSRKFSQIYISLYILSSVEYSLKLMLTFLLILIKLYIFHIFSHFYFIYCELSVSYSSKFGSQCFYCEFI